MSQSREIDHQAFDKMLDWLNPNRELAGQKYEAIRTRLIKILQYRGSQSAEEIADESFDRAAQKIDFLLANYEGDPARYLLGIAQKVHLEFQKRPIFQELPDETAVVAPEVEESFQPEYECLQKCLQTLTPERRQFILSYHAEQKSVKIKNRKNLADHNGLQSNTMYVRAFRIRARLQKCVLDCLAGRQ